PPDRGQPGLRDDHDDDEPDRRTLAPLDPAARGGELGDQAMQALRTAATGMAAQQLNVEVISNNIANMNTVGFKRQRAEFEDLLYQTLEQAGAQSSNQGNIVPTGVQIGAGGKPASVYRTPTQGTPTQT